MSQFSLSLKETGWPRAARSTLANTVLAEQVVDEREPSKLRLGRSSPSKRVETSRGCSPKSPEDNSSREGGWPAGSGFLETEREVKISVRVMKKEGGGRRFSC